MDCKSAMKFFYEEFNKQDIWLATQGLTVKDLDVMTDSEYQEINTKWREYDRQQKALFKTAKGAGDVGTINYIENSQE